VKKSIVLYMHMHQPYRVGKYSIFDVGVKSDYFVGDREIFLKVADKSYRPMLKMLRKCMDENPEFKLSLSVTGMFIEQARDWASDIIEDMKALAATGRCEFLTETYYHSLSFFYNKDEFESQVKLHQNMIEEYFGQKPKFFRNTELAYNDDLAKWAEDFGFTGILAEGWDSILGWQSPNWVYVPRDCSKIRLLTKNYRLSDDIAFRFSDKSWSEYPLTVDKYLHWLNVDTLRGPLINLFMDFETFGEHQWADTGIFEFFDVLVDAWTKDGGGFMTVSEAAGSMEPKSEVSMRETVTWADTERDLTAWMGNAMQGEAMSYVYRMMADVLRTGNNELVRDWRRLTASDHAYYMCTKYFNDGDVHAYFSPYDSPYDAFMYYMNVVRDVRYRIGQG